MLRTFQRLAAAILLALPAAAASPARDAAELEQRLTHILADNHVPGLAAVIAGRDGVLWTAGLGLADVAGARALTAETPLRVGSVSKTFVALALLRLAEEGRVDLEAPLASLLPEVPFSNPWEATDPVRVIHLLAHTTGWDDLHARDRAVNVPRTLAQGLAENRSSRACRWRPGTRFAYCNSGPSVGAALVEKLTGRTFEAYVNETFFGPLGMATASFAPGPAVARSYHPDGITPYPYWHLSLRPSGALNASARDMGALLAFLLRRGQAGVLSQASLHRMETPASGWEARAGLSTAYALCSYGSPDEAGFTWQGHGGSLPGALARLAYLPGEGRGFFFALNAHDARCEAAVARELAAFAERGLVPPPLPGTVPLASNLAGDFGGWYRPEAPRLQSRAFLDHLLGLRRIGFQGGRLLLKPLFGKAQIFLPMDDHRFRREREGAPILALVAQEEGRFLLLPSVTTARRVPAVAVWGELALVALSLLGLASIPVAGAVQVLRRRALRPLAPHLLAFLCAALYLGAAWYGEGAPGPRLGRMTACSISLWLASLGFAASSFLALASTLRRGSRTWTRVVACALVAGTFWLAWWGVIGYRTWI
jgi:CubicO group peptidase (beta-lactamase class C family)